MRKFKEIPKHKGGTHDIRVQRLILPAITFVGNCMRDNTEKKAKE
jgi:hypothetical protein